MNDGPRYRGRAARRDPRTRFDDREIVLDPVELDEADDLRPRTRYFEDASRSLITRNDSPDVGFDASLNPYRGCEHGCSYCYARPTHEYLGLSAGLDFETRVFVKRRAPELLEAALAKPSWTPTPLALSGVTDPYQPAERTLRVTRGCLEVLHACRHPASVITKNALVTRDADLLAGLAEHDAVHVTLSLTTLDEDLRARMEPRTSTAERRLEAIRALAAAGVPVGVNVAPIVPGLTDVEVPALLEAAAEAGARFAGFTLLRLPGTVAEVFGEWLETLPPERAERILARVREARGGALNDGRFGHRMRGKGAYAEQIGALFRSAARRHGLASGPPPLARDAFRPPDTSPQPSLFPGALRSTVR